MLSVLKSAMLLMCRHFKLKLIIYINDTQINDSPYAIS